MEDAAATGLGVAHILLVPSLQESSISSWTV